LREHFGRILHRYPIGSEIPEPDATDLRWLIERHPETAQKIGAGVARFTVQENPPYNTRGFWIERVDGTRIDFSYLACVNGRPPALGEVAAAMRDEVADDIWRAKRTYFDEHAVDGKVPCAETGKPISIEEAHADHAEPYRFNTLATTFLAARGIVPDAGLIETSPDDMRQRFKDRRLARDWIAYHHKLACIRIVDARVNMADGHKSEVKLGNRQLDLGRV
jgi:hypothetical protein